MKLKIYQLNGIIGVSLKCGITDEYNRSGVNQKITLKYK
jgi:hypothetical protein